MDSLRGVNVSRVRGIMIKDMPDEMLKRHAKEMANWIFEESGCTIYDMTLIEGVMDYTLIRELMLSELNCYLSEATLSWIFSNSGTLFPKGEGVNLYKQYDKNGRITCQAVIE